MTHGVCTAKVKINEVMHDIPSPVGFGVAHFYFDDKCPLNKSIETFFNNFASSTRFGLKSLLKLSEFEVATSNNRRFHVEKVDGKYCAFELVEA